jgi:hypothetical protein
MQGDMQHLYFTVQVRAHIQKDAHTTHIHETVYATLAEALKDILMDSDELPSTLPPLDVNLGFNNMSGYSSFEEYDRRTVLSPEAATGYLRRTFTGDDKDVVEEYIDEFEHQEGTEGAWAHFHTFSELDEDFTLYRETKEALDDIPNLSDEGT